MRSWRNGRRARLRGVWETVLVRVQSTAPIHRKNAEFQRSFCFYCSFSFKQKTSYVRIVLVRQPHYRKQGGSPTKDNNSLSYTTWNCKYHIVFAPKYKVSDIVGYLKGKSSLMIFDRHAKLKYKYGNLLILSKERGIFKNWSGNNILEITMVLCQMVLVKNISTTINVVVLGKNSMLQLYFFHSLFFYSYSFKFLLH